MKIKTTLQVREFYDDENNNTIAIINILYDEDGSNVVTMNITKKPITRYELLGILEQMKYHIIAEFE